MECNFFVGQKVVCVDLKKRKPGDLLSPKFRKGKVYVVEAIVRWRGDCGLVIEGMHSLHKTRAYLASAFRPVTDISDLQKIVSEVFAKKPASVSA